MNELSEMLKDQDLSESVKLTMLTAYNLFVEPAENFNDMAALFLALTGIIAEEHPYEIDLYLKALCASRTINKKGAYHDPKNDSGLSAIPS